MFMALFFCGGAFASAVTSPLMEGAGWPGICVLGAVMPLLALGYFFVVRARA
jgi:hypothetical protein